LKYFKLNFPIDDYSGAWKIVIINYRNALKELMEIIEKDNVG